jgi:formate dehydrogenase major subunit
MEDSTACVVMGSNMAENHPVAFRWPMKAKGEHGAKLIHVDPRFTRTSAMADIYAPLRAGSDIAFLGGLVNFVLNSERWNKDPFFRDLRHDLHQRGHDRLRRVPRHRGHDGVFSGLMAYTGDAPEWPFNGFVASTTTRPGATRAGGRRAGPGGGVQVADLGKGARRAKGGPERAARTAARAGPGASGPALRLAGAGLLQPPEQRDDT